MPRRRTTKSRKVVARRRRGGARQRGRGFMDFLRGANRFLKRTKLISRAGRIGSMLGVPYVGTIGKYAGKVGYGRKRTVRRRRRKGRGLSTAGGALALAGRGRKKRLTAIPRAGIAY